MSLTSADLPTRYVLIPVAGIQETVRINGQLKEPVAMFLLQCLSKKLITLRDDSLDVHAFGIVGDRRGLFSRILTEGVLYSTVLDKLFPNNRRVILYPNEGTLELALANRKPVALSDGRLSLVHEHSSGASYHRVIPTETIILSPQNN